MGGAGQVSSLVSPLAATEEDDVEVLDEAEVGAALVPSPPIKATEEHTERGSGLSSELEISPDADVPMRLAIDPKKALFKGSGRCSAGSMRL